MKKLFLFFPFSFIVVFSAKAQLGIQAGGDLYKSKISANNISVSYDYKPGFTGGVFIRYL